MLEALRIRNFALAENVRVEFRPGLNVITGETGAGKSLLIAALGLLIGDRGDKALIRAGEEACSVEGDLLLADARAANALLEEMGLPACEEGRLTLRRSLSVAGPGRSHVNDSAASLAGLVRLGDVLVDLHGPHDHQSLLKPAFQLELVDAFGRCAAGREAYSDEFGALRALERERDDLEARRRAPGGGEDFLRYQAEEIEQGKLSADDEAPLEQELTRVGNAARILELARDTCAALGEGDGCAFQGLVAAQHMLPELERLMGDAAKDWLPEARGIAVRIQELTAAIASAATAVEADPARLQWLEDRKALVHRLTRKYGGSVTSALEAARCARTCWPTARSASQSWSGASPPRGCGCGPRAPSSPRSASRPPDGSPVP